MFREYVQEFRLELNFISKFLYQTLLRLCLSTHAFFPWILIVNTDIKNPLHHRLTYRNNVALSAKNANATNCIKSLSTKSPRNVKQLKEDVVTIVNSKVSVVKLSQFSGKRSVVPVINVDNKLKTNVSLTG